MNHKNKKRGTVKYLGWASPDDPIYKRGTTIIFSNGLDRIPIEKSEEKVENDIKPDPYCNIWSNKLGRFLNKKEFALFNALRMFKGLINDENPFRYSVDSFDKFINSLKNNKDPLDYLRDKIGKLHPIAISIDE